MLAALLLVGPFSAGCGKPFDPVIGVAEDDAEMNKAIGTAKSRLGEFDAALREPRPDRSHFTVKKPFPTTDGSVEHIWIGNVRFEGGAYHGTIENEPVNVDGLKYGDAASATPSEISDWMYVENDEVVGGWTMRVLYNRATPEAQKKQWGSIKFRKESGAKP